LRKFIGKMIGSLSDKALRARMDPHLEATAQVQLVAAAACGGGGAAVG
jgi:hypothetical protein